jgi:hypothetical protein
MTRQEAYEAMQKGEKITHDYFMPHEYYYMLHGKGPILAEDGVDHSRAPSGIAAPTTSKNLVGTYTMRINWFYQINPLSLHSKIETICKNKYR